MFCWLRRVIIGLSVIVLSFPAYGREISREQITGLDEQIQEIKSDVLSIAVELNQLEEKLLYPSNTQVAVFVSASKDKAFRLDAVEIQLGGRPVAHHIYTYKELEALQKGGVQRIYTGNIKTGQHHLQVSVIGKTDGNADFHITKDFMFTKDVGPKIVELSLAAHGVSLKE
jgi:hypothetical protein